MQYVIGVDCGTEGVRAGIFSIDGRQVALSTRPYSVNFLANGWVEQDPNMVFSAVLDTIKDLVSLEKVKIDNIAAIGIDATAVTLVASDASGKALQDSILWMDKRAYKEADEINKLDHSSLFFTGGSVSPEWALPKIMWLKRNQPELYAKAAYLVDLVDWLIFQLTGTWKASLCNLVTEWNYVADEKGWDIGFLEQLGISDLLNKVPEDIIPMGGSVGKLRKEVAEYINLNPDIPVISAGMDSYAASVGLGVTEEKRMACSIGSSSCYLMLSSKPLQVKGLFGPMQGPITPDKWALQGGQTSAATIIKWFRQLFVTNDEAEDARKSNLSIYAWLDNQVKDLEPGSRGLITLDNWQGNRTPLRDPSLTGAIWGLTLHHNKWHIYKSLLESIAYGGRAIIESFQRAGISTKEVYVCGGGAASDLWLQIHADVLGLPVIRTEVQQSAALGSAICAAAGAGIYSTICETATNMVRVEKAFKPVQRKTKEYDFLYQLYSESCKRLIAPMHKLERYKNMKMLDSWQ